MLTTICYISSADKKLGQNELNQLFNNAKINNSKFDISGILIHQDGNFLQILEGENEKIDEVYQRIKLDNRHSNILQIINHPITSSIFEGYQTGFSIVNNNKKIEQLKTYLEWVKSAEIASVDKIIGIIENFIYTKA